MTPNQNSTKRKERFLSEGTASLPGGAAASSASRTVTAPLTAGASHAAWKPRVNPWLIAATVALAAFMEVLDTSIANVALPHIAGTLGASTDEGTWVLTSYLVSNAIVLPLGGWASSVMGRRNFFVILHHDLHRRQLSLRRGAHAADAAGVPRDAGRGRRRNAAHGAGHHGRLALSRKSAGRPLRSTAWWRCWRPRSAPRWAAGSPTTSPGAGSSSSTFRWASWPLSW